MSLFKLWIRLCWFRNIANDKAVYFVKLLEVFILFYFFVLWIKLMWKIWRMGVGVNQLTYGNQSTQSTSTVAVSEADILLVSPFLISLYIFCQNTITCLFTLFGFSLLFVLSHPLFLIWILAIVNTILCRQDIIYHIRLLGPLAHQFNAVIEFLVDACVHDEIIFA